MEEPLSLCLSLYLSHLVQRDFHITIRDLLPQILRVFPINHSTHRDAHAENLLDGPTEVFGHMGLGRITLVVSTTSSREIFPLCLIFFVFFRSHSGSFNALMTRVAADGTTDTLAWQFRTVSFTADWSLGRMNLQYQLHLWWLGLSFKPTQFSSKLEFHRVFYFWF